MNFGSHQKHDPSHFKSVFSVQFCIYCETPIEKNITEITPMTQLIKYSYLHLHTA